MTKNWLAGLKSLIAGKAGTSAMEFALIAPALIIIPIPVVDAGLGLYAQMEVREAAQAGAQYALLHAYDSAQILAAATAATPLSVTITSQQNCGCPNGTSITLGGAPGTCAACAGGGAAGTYVQVTSAATYRPPIAFAPIIKNSYALSGSSVVRVVQ